VAPAFGQAPPAANMPGAVPAELRTLFHSAAEREKLDRARRGEPAEEEAVAGGKRGPPKITGFVRRSDGRDTVWLDLNENGRLDDSEQPLSDVRAKTL